MGKIIINSGSLVKHQPGGEHITRIMYDDNQPPKHYIWGKQDGFLYKWNGKEWEKLEKRDKHWYPICTPFVTKSKLNKKLNEQKVSIISYMTKLIKTHSDPSGTVIDWINDNIVPDIRALQDIDHSEFVVTEEVQE